MKILLIYELMVYNKLVGQKSFKWDFKRPKELLNLHKILNLQKKIVPELVEVLEKRYSILRTINYNAPIGRRMLASKLELGERIVRTEVNFLKDMNLIEIGTPGMTVTSEGTEVLDDLKWFIHELKGLSKLEQKVKELLKVRKVIVVPGNVQIGRAHV